MGTMLDTVNDSTITLVDQGVIQTLNPVTTKSFDYAVKELIGRYKKSSCPARIKNTTTIVTFLVSAT